MKDKIKRSALLFLLLLGIISFFSDFTHEGARSIYGPYLGLIGASAFAIAFAAGLGELIGHAFRLVTGWIADKTKKYWLMMMLGYAINLLAIPLLSFVGPSIWEIAIVLILVERVGKAIRAPAKSALTSFTAPHIGAGKAFAINEALDQLGAFLGPLIIFLVIRRSGGGSLDAYQMSFLFLGIFAVLTLAILVFAKIKYPNPDDFEKPSSTSKTIIKDRPFWIYMIAIGLIAMAFIDYPIIAYHIDQKAIIDATYIPLLYAMAMGVDAVSALFFGHLFDKKGLWSLIIAMSITSFTALLVFYFGTSWMVIVGIGLWGIGMGAQESILKAVVAKMIPKDKRATGYGIFSTVFGSFWFVGSLIVGWLITYDPIYITLYVFIVMGLSLMVLAYLMKIQKHQITT